MAFCCLQVCVQNKIIGISTEGCHLPWLYLVRLAKHATVVCDRSCCAGLADIIKKLVFVPAEVFNKVLEVDQSAFTVRVQSGLKVLDLLRWADKNGMATELGAPTNYAELTIGGVISANGHGTGSNVTSSMVSWQGKH